MRYVQAKDAINARTCLWPSDSMAREDLFHLVCSFLGSLSRWRRESSALEILWSNGPQFSHYV